MLRLWQRVFCGRLWREVNMSKLELFYQLCENYNVKFSEDYTEPMIEVYDGKIIPLAEYLHQIEKGWELEKDNRRVLDTNNMSSDVDSDNDIPILR